MFQVYGRESNDHMAGYKLLPLTFIKSGDPRIQQVLTEHPTSLFLSDTNDLLTIPAISSKDELMTMYLVNDNSDQSNQGILFDDNNKAQHFISNYQTMKDYFSSPVFKKSKTFLLLNLQTIDIFEEEAAAYLKGVLWWNRMDVNYFSLFQDATLNERLLTALEDQTGLKSDISLSPWRAMAFPSNITLQTIKENFPKSWRIHCHLTQGLPLPVDHALPTRSWTLSFFQQFNPFKSTDNVGELKPLLQVKS